MRIWRYFILGGLGEALGGGISARGKGMEGWEGELCVGLS